jgi:hypothetical protein
LGNDFLILVVNIDDGIWELFPAIHYNLFFALQAQKRISVSIGAISTFVSPQKLQKGGAADSLC